MDTNKVKVVKSMSAQGFENELNEIIKENEEQNLLITIDYKPLLNAKEQIVYTALVAMQG